MNHLNRKKRLHGAGKKPKVTPAVLSPPKIGDFQFGASFSYVETLDLISDGPIEGLVDPKGNLLDPSEKSRGVYLDGTSVSVKIEGDDSNLEKSHVSDSKISIDVTSFSNFNTYDYPAGINETFRYLDAGYYKGLKSISVYGELVYGNDPLVSFANNDFNPITSSSYYRDQDTWAYLDIQEKKTNYHYEYIFPNQSTVADSDFVVGYVRDNKTQEHRGFTTIADYFFAEKYSDVAYEKGSSGASFFQKILELWDTYQDSTNSIMKDMIEYKMSKVFGSYDWKKSSAKDLYNKFFKRGIYSGYIGIYYPSRDLLSGATSVQFPTTSGKRIAFVPSDSNDKQSNIFRTNGYNDLLFPIIDADGNVDTSADLVGAIIFIQPNSYVPFEYDSGSLILLQEGNTSKYRFKETIEKLKLVTRFNLKDTDIKTESKYNYNNVLIESRNGEEFQEPFRYFNKVHIDKSVNKNVYGPFRSEGQVQRIRRDEYSNKSTISMDSVYYDGPENFIDLVNGIPTNEGSNDNQRAATKDYSSWVSNNQNYKLEENAAPVTYTINNPNVSEVFVTLQIDSLFDTVEKSYQTDPDDNDFKIGDKLPAIMNVEIEVGKILADGSTQPTLNKKYRISALIESATLLDIGNPSNTNSPDQFKHVRDLSNVNGNANLSVPFPLPRVNNYSSNNVFSSPEKRYVKVNKLSTETFSILISKELTFYKVTEIIPVNLTYPFSAIVGTKIDSRSFSSLPQRSFDARLKKVKIPTNYYPTNDFYPKKDKRYYEVASELQEVSADEKLIYDGDWYGEFKEGWTDNPAWILYDLLTNNRYGLGQYVEEEDINKWELYKIGRFCDAVDSDGNFIGVPDGRGGLEPRYSCNILFKSDEKVFDSIQLISKLFRGHTFFRASEVSFSDERIKSPIAIFNNNNIKDGAFNYSNLRRDQQFNTVEVSYLDRFENFAPKVEVVEDEEDIRSRGIFKKRIDGMGVTSRAMARRIGQHLIYRTIKENQRVAFTSGLEALLCQPGDLIIIDDDLKNEKSNFGKVLNIDLNNEYIQLSGPWSTQTMTGILTIYNPTGESSISELTTLAQSRRQRVDDFTVTGSFAGFEPYTGYYQFSGYTDGYSYDDLEELNLYSQYALYTGTGDNILYFNSEYTGWMFATGLDESDDYYIAKDTGVQTLSQLNSAILSDYQISQATKRSTTERDITDYISGDIGATDDVGGILESEINLNSQPQIITLYPDTVGTGDGFTFASGFDYPEYLENIKLGSPYRFDLRSADDILYKIDSIKENNPNEYLVSAAKFDTGKFSLIEDSISLDRRENTYDYNVATQIGDVTYSGLDYPENLALTTGEGSLTSTFYVRGDWDAVSDNNGYEAILYLPNGNTVSSGISTEYVVFDNLSTVGNYALSVKAVGDSSTSDKTIDSEFSTVRSFILYEELEEFSKSFTQFITFR